MLSPIECLEKAQQNLLINPDYLGPLGAQVATAWAYIAEVQLRAGMVPIGNGQIPKEPHQ